MSDVKNPSNFLPLKLSKKDFLQYKEALDKFFSTRKEDYKNLFESFEILKKKKLHLSYLLFSYYNSWIFPYISYTKITRGNIFSSSFEISLIFKKLSKNMNCPFDEKLFVLWYFYIYYNFFVKEKNTGENTLINQMRYILCETGKIVINLFEQKILTIKSVINILDLNLFCLEYFMINSEFLQLTDKKQKLRKLIIFLNFFHLLKKISIITLKQNAGFESVLTYLYKIKNNSEINDEINIIILFNNNILQDFMQNLLDNMNIYELNKTIPDLKNKLANFYGYFLKNKYKLSKTFNILQDTLRHSFEHLYNFKQNKNLIIRDVFKIDFYSTILNKLFKNSDKDNVKNIDYLNQINSSFFFNTKLSGISFESTKKLSLEQSIFFFSFRNNNINIEDNQEIPLLIIFRKNSKKAEKSVGLKIFLKKFEKDTFKLYFSQPKDNKDENLKILNEDSDIIINNNQTYYFAISLGKKSKTFLLEDNKNNLNKIFSQSIVLNHQLNNEFFSFYLGKDDKNINFFKGFIGPLIIIKSPKDNVDKNIEEIISLKENYKDFLIIKSELSKNYNFISKNYFSNDFLKESKNIELIKGNFDCLLYLSPEFIKYYKNEITYDEKLTSLENNTKKIPLIYECMNQNCEFIITELNASIYNEENFIKLILADNSINYFSLLFEYFSQLFRFYALKKEKEKIFEENEIKLVINHCIESIKNNLPISWKYKYPIYSDYTYKSLKTILNNLYNCISNMNKIEPIFITIYEDLLNLKHGNKSFFNASFTNEYDKNQIEQNDFKSKLDFEKYNKNKYIKYNINLFIGVVEILLTPDFYNIKESSSYLIIINKILEDVFKDIKNNINMIDLSLMNNIFYKLLSFMQMLSENFSKNENEIKNEIILKDNEDKQENDLYQKLIKNIFEVIIEILNAKYNNNEDKLRVKDYFNKLFLFVFGCHIYNYDLVLNYLSVIDSQSLNLKFEENQIIELKNILFKFEKYKDNKINENKENINIIENKIGAIQGFIISKIYEYIFLNFNENCPIKINFLEEILKKNNISNIFIRIQRLLEKYFANIFKKEESKEGNTNNIFIDMDYIKLNKYLKKIFEFLRFFLRILNNEELKDLKEIPQYFDFIYDLLYDAQRNMEIQETNFEKCIIFLLNYLEFIHISIYEGEKDNYNINFLYREEKIVKIIEELYDKCVESTLIHCDFYFIIKDEKNLTSTVQEKKLILEIFFDFYGNILMTVYNKYRMPQEKKNEINEKYIAFIQGLNTFLEQKLISEFNPEAFDIKNTPYLKKFKSVFFLSDFYKLAFHHNKYEKKYLKVKQLKDFPKQMNFYKKIQEIISKMKLDFIDANNQFNYFHTTYFFYLLCNLNNVKLSPFINDEEIKKHEDLKESLEEIQSSMRKLKEIIISDHFKMNFICKEYYYKKRTTNDSDLKNMLKTIQVIIFNKKLKNIEKHDLVQEIEKEFKTNEIKSRKSENSRGSSNSTGSNPKKTHTSSLGSKDSFDGSNPSTSSDVVIGINRESNEFEINSILNIKKDENLIPLEKNEIKEVTINESFNDQIQSLKKLIKECNEKNILEKIDKYTIINPKKEFMKKIFGIYYSDAFFENDTFEKLKQLYLNTITNSNSETKLLNYPSKIKNFGNGLEPCNFLKENDKFFITKMFPITHQYFYEYMIKHNSLNDSIILLKSYLFNETKLENEINNLNLKKFECEIIKPDKTYYGQIINSDKEKFILFSSKKFELLDNTLDSNEIVKQIKQRGFSLSVLKNLETENAKKARENAKNYLLDKDIYPEEEFNLDKKILIFYDDIEEIVERRILYSWQGFEIFLKNGKSYMINMLNKTNYDEIIDILKSSNKNILFRDKDFLNNKQEITNQWKIKKLPTYEYLLFINKFSSRSYNDISQYYIFPWILLDFSQINEIIKNEKDIFEFKKKHKIESLIKREKKEQEKKEKKENEKKGKKEKKEKETKNKKEASEEKVNIERVQKSNEKLLELLKQFRDLKYPVTAQGDKQKQIKKEKYDDEEEKFKVHHGTHYSTGSYVEYYLMRNEPYTTLIVELQNYTQEDPNRLLLRIKDTINIINTGYDNRELIPELFSKIDYLVNVNCGFLGIKKNKELVDDIDFNMEKSPLTIYNNITYGSKFILLHKKILNSDAIALNLNNWIDNIFGVMQFPQQKRIKEKSLNIFPKSTYEQLNDLEEKLKKLSDKYKEDSSKLIKRFINKINVIISFGQCPHVVFHEEHKNRDLIKLTTTNSEEKENYGLQDDYQGTDFIDTYVLEQLKNDNSDNILKTHGIYFETNPQIEKEFILSSNSELIIVDTNFYNYNSPKKYGWNFITDIIKLPSICLFTNIQNEKNNNFYIYNLKYAFSSFPSDNMNNNINNNNITKTSKNKTNDKNKINDINNNINKSSYYLYANKIINNIPKIFEEQTEKCKIITCRHIDNSFKLHFISLNTKRKKLLGIETYSYICEDFVMCCKAISNNSFIIALRNGKLIKANLYEFNNNNIDDKNKKKSGYEFEVTFDKYITGHIGSINVLEINERLGIVITGGDDNKIIIRKLYDFELLTTIKLKKKFIITMVKVSENNLLYVICFNKRKGKNIIFGYSLSGLKFAKSEYSLFTNLEFTPGGNIITLENNSKLKILYGYNLQEMNLNEKDNDYQKYIKMLQSFNNDNDNIGWIQFNDYKKYYGNERSIISFTKEINKKNYIYQTLKVTNISYFE